MRRLNYFGLNFTRIRLGSFVLASVSSSAHADEATHKDEQLPRKREVTLRLKSDSKAKTPILDHQNESSKE